MKACRKLLALAMRAPDADNRRGAIIHYPCLPRDDYPLSITHALRLSIIHAGRHRRRTPSKHARQVCTSSTCRRSQCNSEMGFATTDATARQLAHHAWWWWCGRSGPPDYPLSKVLEGRLSIIRGTARPIIHYPLFASGALQCSLPMLQISH